MHGESENGQHKIAFSRQIGKCDPTSADEKWTNGRQSQTGVRCCDLSALARRSVSRARYDLRALCALSIEIPPIRGRREA